MLESNIHNTVKSANGTLQAERTVENNRLSVMMPHIYSAFRSTRGGEPKMTKTNTKQKHLHRSSQ